MAIEFGSSGSERIGAVNSGRESVAGGIASAAKNEGPNSLDNALKSFAWADTQQVHQADALNDFSVDIQPSGHTEPPADFLGRSADLSHFSSIVEMERVLSNLKSQDFNFNDGLTNLAEGGLKEAFLAKDNLLTALGIRLAGGKAPAAEILAGTPNLDGLLQGQAFKNPDTAQLEGAVHKLSQMFGAVDGVVQANMDIRLNILRGMRV
jgi:hypothetical protein